MKKSLQKFTPKKLSKAGGRLLATLSKAENYSKSVKDICKLAKISRMWYYQLYKRKEFREQAIKLARQIFAAATPVVAHSVVKKAIDGSLVHQRIILEATNVIQPLGGPTVAVQQAGNITYVIKGTKTDDEFRKELNRSSS